MSRIIKILIAAILVGGLIFAGITTYMEHKRIEEDANAALMDMLIEKNEDENANDKITYVDVEEKEEIESIIKERDLNISIDIASNPEFLKEGVAVEDCMRPDRIVIGAENEEVFAALKKLYAPFVSNHHRFILMDVKSSEMTKYVANAMLATKISFINEIANICELTGANVKKVRLGIGSDKRIGYNFIYAGCGYGGSCFPKDVQGLIDTAKSYGYEPLLLSNVENVNKNQKMILVEKIVKRFGEDLSKFTFGIWGLAFKPNTDDLREALKLDEGDSVFFYVDKNNKFYPDKITDVEDLGICPGDFIFIDPKTTITESGFIKSRFIDDKGSVCCLLTILEKIAKKVIALSYDDTKTTAATAADKSYIIGGVAAYAQGNPSSNGMVNKVCDIYRLQDGKLAEHWDVLQKP